MIESILWRRLDVPGHDACRLLQYDAGWRLEGAAAFLHEGVPASLGYELRCDGEWRSREGVVHGWIGARRIDLGITRSPDGVWTVNGAVVPGLDGCVDLDLGFTPATNLFQLRRIALPVGQAAEVPVAWLDAAAGTLEQLHQRYERPAPESYWYEAPHFEYFDLLQVGAVGFVEKYPGLWEAEERRPSDG